MTIMWVQISWDFRNAHWAMLYTDQSPSGELAGSRAAIVISYPSILQLQAFWDPHSVQFYFLGLFTSFIANKLSIFTVFIPERNRIWLTWLIWKLDYLIIWWDIIHIEVLDSVIDQPCVEETTYLWSEEDKFRWNNKQPWHFVLLWQKFLPYTTRTLQDSRELFPCPFILRSRLTKQPPTWVLSVVMAKGKKELWKALELHLPFILEMKLKSPIKQNWWTWSARLACFLKAED